MLKHLNTRNGLVGLFPFGGTKAERFLDLKQSLFFSLSWVDIDFF